MRSILLRPTFLLLLTLLIVTAAGCAASPPAPALTPTSLVATVTATRAPSATPFPSLTPYPTRTPLPSATFTPLPTATATPDPALAEVKLLGISWLENYDMLLSIRFPGPVDPDDYRVVVEEKEHDCQVLPEAPNRLICIGQGTNVYDRVTVQIYPRGSDQAGFEGQIFVPFFNN
jgi:hypothetical protein